MWGIVVFVMDFTTPAYSADTWECYDLGFSDFEFYLGVEGLDKTHENVVYNASTYLGFGILPQMSGYLGVMVSSNRYFQEAVGGLNFGIFGTPVDTDHVDLDLILDLNLSGQSFSDFVAAPGLELNFDLDPDLATWGSYISVFQLLSGREENTPQRNIPQQGSSDGIYIEESNKGKSKFVFVQSTYLLLGTYYTIQEGQQLLLEYDMTFNHRPAEDERHMDVGGINVGFNVMLTDGLEMINSVRFDIPQKNEDFAFGISTGFLATFSLGKGEIEAVK